MFFLLFEFKPIPKVIEDVSLRQVKRLSRWTMCLGAASIVKIQAVSKAAGVKKTEWDKASGS